MSEDHLQEVDRAMFDPDEVWEDEDSNGAMTSEGFLPEDFVTMAVNGDEVVFTRHGPRDGDGVDMARHGRGWIRIFPREGSDVGSEAAYQQLREIRVESMTPPTLEENSRGDLYLDGLPDGLGTYFQYGLTFPRRYRCLVSAIEENTSCTILQISRAGPMVAVGNTLTVPLGKFKAFLAEIDTHHERASTIVARLKGASAKNLVAEANGEAPQEPIRGRLEIIQKMTGSILGEEQLDDLEMNALLELMVSQAEAAVKSKPEAIGRLRNDLELVSLEVLIEKFEQAMTSDRAAKSEAFWQSFFSKNPLVLQQLFGFPVVNVAEGQLQVEPARSNKVGSRITDFLLVNTLTGEGLIVEIKTPSATLMEAKAYRGSGSSAVLRPHRDLTGAVAQLQSQMDSLQERLAQKLKPDDPLVRLTLPASRGVLIVGCVAELKGASLDSFRRYREGLHAVSLLGFDEVLEHLKVLMALLKASEEAAK